MDHDSPQQQGDRSVPLRAGSFAHAARSLRSVGGPVLFPQLYVWLVLVSSLDVIFTTIILYLGGHEVNPVADALLDRWGLFGLIGLKFVAISVAIVICEWIGRMRYTTGRRLAEWAIAISVIPVVVAASQLIVWAWM